MKKFTATVLAIGMIGVAGFTFANEKKIPVEITQTESSEIGTQEFSGLIINSENGVTLMSDDTAYQLKGAEVEVLEALIGKKVKVNGKLVKDDTSNTILIAKIEESK